MNGKGDKYRPVNKKTSDENHDKIFGKRDEIDFQKCNRFKKINPRHNLTTKGI
jgi:hypothetical protein